ncbi:Protein of unknown function DUF247, partial [Theobroma cacao]
MVLVDASFIIELFLRAFNKEGRAESDFIFDEPGKIHTIRRDLFLAHNQLPFFILKALYELAFAANPDHPSFLHLTCHFFGPYYNQNTSIQDITSSSDCHDKYRDKLGFAKHFTDLLRTLHLPYSFQTDCSQEKPLCCKLPQFKWIKTKVMYFLDLISSSLLPSSQKPEQSLEAGQVHGEYLYSAVLLHEAGVKFKVSTSRCLLDIEFNQNNGELKIPPLRLDELTESFFRNLMAWEQRYYPHETLICDYIFLMEYLIKSTEDVDLLVRKRILINQLGSHKAVVTLFNNFCKHVTPMEKNHYSDIFTKLNAHNAVRRHSWIAILKLHWDFLSHEIRQDIVASNGRSELFIEMVLVDASFIIELFLRAFNKEGRAESDFIFDEPGKIHTIRQDLFLAHNQLPFFILKALYELAFAGNPDHPSFLHLTCHFFGPYYNQNISIQDIISPSDCHDRYRAKLGGAKHFTDLLRILQLPCSFQTDCGKEKSLCCKLPQIKWIKTKVMYFLDLTSSSLLPSSKKPEQSLEAGKVQGEYLYSAVLLREAGVKFKVSTSRCLLDIEFNQNKGELKIPPLRLDELTESFFRNLMAWEQRYYPHETLICDYIFLMEYLIKFTEDVDLLVRKRILINQLGSHKAVVTLFNNLCKHVTPMEKNHYSDIFRKLNAYNAVRHHSWIAILKL